MEGKGQGPTPVERLFLEYVERFSSGACADFEAFCDKHAQHAQELRGLREQWLQVHRLLGRASADDPRRPADVSALRHSRYWIRDEINRGGQGEVLLVWEPHLGRELALKRVREDAVTPVSSSTRSPHDSRLVDEAQITGQLAHPGIVSVHEVGVDADDRVYFTMELVRGREFAEIISLVRGEDDGWTLPAALRVLLQVCNAVAYAHSKNVIHRDLKPSNVMVGRFGETYVMDWGFAKVLDPGERDELAATVSATTLATARTRERRQDPASPLVTQEGDVFGTPMYMPPEQARGQHGQMGPQSDVYAVGAMLYHLLTGQPPYRPQGSGLSAATVIDRLKQGPPTPVRELAPDAPDELVDICQEAMSRRPQDRYADMSAMARDLEAYLDHRPISSRSGSPLYQLRLACERNRKLVGTALAAAAVLCLVTLIYVARLRKEQTVSARQLDFYAASSLHSQADGLVPPTPAVVPALDAWLSGADDLLTRFPRYERELEQAGEPPPAQLAEAVATMRQLRDQRAQLRARRELAAGLHERSIGSEARAWETAVASIASLDVYGGLRLDPQLGLVPLEVDPHSGLWEFWHVLSGERPARSENGAYTITEETGMVLVLTPDGRFPMGSPPDEPDRVSNERQRNIRVEPFFISKFETTQAQWLRAMGTNPSYLAAGPARSETPTGGVRIEEITPIHPVENVSWHQVVALARRLDLRLPTEAEWEYAARAGTETMHAFGDRYEDLEGKENLRDLSLSPTITEQNGFDWNDGFSAHAPVGHFTPNPFGLYDVHGNVSEWSADEFRDPLQNPSSEPLRVFRGGSWYSSFFTNRAAYRNFAVPGTFNQALGVRLARGVRASCGPRR